MKKPYKFYVRILLVMCLSIANLVDSYAQTSEIRGRIFDSDGKTPLPFATVVVKGTTTGTVTDSSGYYSIKAPARSTLCFSLLGYATEEILLTGDRTTIDVVMKQDAIEVEDVVVTALGITRKQKSLGYAVSTVAGEAISATLSSNWLNGMDGKVAGMNFDSASTGPGGSIRVTLRGEGSLSHDKNTALFVIDGVPISSSMTASSSDGGYGSGDAPIDYGNGASDLNPDDIASVSVLKGPAATALYGSQAANGAVIITTKSGQEHGSGLGVTFTSSVVLERAGFWPDFQDEYGAGNGNANGRLAQTAYSFWNVPADMSDTGEAVKRNYSRVAYGPRFEGQMFYNYDSARWQQKDGKWSIAGYERTPWQAQDWYKGAFETGVTYSNNISIAYNGGKGNSVRFSFRDTRNEWILPNTGYTSQTFTMSLNQKIGKYITLGAKASYYRKDSDNLPTTGYNSASPLYTLIFNTPSTSVKWIKDEYFSGRMQYFLRQYYRMGSDSANLINYTADNLYMILYEHLNTLDRDRVYGNANVTFHILPNLTLLLRSGIDFSSDFRTQRKPTFTQSYNNGYYKEQLVRSFQMTNDLLVSYDKEFAHGISLKVTAGASNFVRNYNNVQLIADRLDEENVFVLQNSVDAVRRVGGRERKMVNSVFGTLSLSWRDMLFLDLTGRNDWSSTLAPGNWSYFYPSVGISWLVDEVFKDKPAWMDMLKVRASWANVGNDTSPYRLVSTYSNSTFPSSYYLPSSLQNYQLKPENVESWEVGIETHLFKNRVSFDVAYYDAKTTNQIISVPTDFITGSAGRYINAGKVTNKGVEISCSVAPVRSRRFRWDINLNWSKNWNKLVELAPGVEVWQMNSNDIGNRVYIYAYPGTELGRIYGQGYKRAPEGAFYLDEGGNKINCAGQIVVDSATGNPVLNGTSVEELYDFGSIYPDWKAGFSQTFSYRNFRLSMSFTAQMGGKAYSSTHFSLAYQGKLKNSLPGRYEGLLVDGVNLNEDGTYAKNQTIVTDIVDYYQTYKFSRNNVEENVFDCSFLKMKELRLEYSLPKKICAKTKFLKEVSVAAYATNLFCITNFPIYDPEVATLTGSSISRGIETGAYPMTRTYGFNLKLSF